MLESLFGPDQIVTRFIAAFVIVFVLIAVIAWLVRRFAAGRINAASPRGRQPRLAVIDASNIDGRRKLVLIRRDNVEHLIMIGGPTDVVVEQNIVRAVPVNAPREPNLRGIADAPPLDVPARASLQDNATPPLRAPAAAPRPAGFRPNLAEPPLRAPEPVRTPSAEDDWDVNGDAAPLAPRAAEGPLRSPRLPEPPLRTEEAPVLRGPVEPPLRPAAPPRPLVEPAVEQRAAAPASDADLADMAQRLESALRRPSAEPDVRGVPGPGNAPRGPAAPRARSEPPRVPVADRPAPQGGNPPAEGGRSVLDSLEEEMASLLGKPQGKE